MDIVIPWVDGNGTSAALGWVSRCFGGGLDAKRFRDNGELRYLLRAICGCLPWAGRIFLLTNGQRPDWLDLSHPRLRLVTHDRFFADPEHLPTSSSLAIEANLWRLGDLGISRRFLYFNDDTFPGRPVDPHLFQTAAGGQVFHVHDFAIPRPKWRADAHHRALVSTGRVLDSAFGKRPWAYLPHAPAVFDLDDLNWLWRRFSGPLGRTSAHRWRRAGDVFMRLLYTHAVAERDAGAGHGARRVVVDEASFLFAAMTDEPRTGALLQRIERERPLFFCLNDDFRSASSARAGARLMTEMLERLFPQRAAWELD